MKSTGIIRRIDDLGRVAIPKDIRRTMRLHDGDPVEFFLSEDKTLCLRRYQPLGEVIKDEATFLLPAFKDSFGVDIIVIDDIGCAIESTERIFIGKRVDNPIPVDVSTVTSVSFNEEEIAISGCHHIIADEHSPSKRYEGTVLVIGETMSGPHIAQAIAIAISQKIEEHF